MATQAALSLPELVGNVILQGLDGKVTDNSAWLFRCILVARVWANEGTRILWSDMDFKPSNQEPGPIEILRSLNPDRRQHYAAMIQRLTDYAFREHDEQFVGIRFPILRYLGLAVTKKCCVAPVLEGAPVKTLWFGWEDKRTWRRHSFDVLFRDIPKLYPDIEAFDFQEVLWLRTQSTVRFLKNYKRIKEYHHSSRAGACTPVMDHLARCEPLEVLTNEWCLKLELKADPFRETLATTAAPFCNLKVLHTDCLTVVQIGQIFPLLVNIREAVFMYAVDRKDPTLMDRYFPFHLPGSHTHLSILKITKGCGTWNHVGEDVTPAHTGTSLVSFAREHPKLKIFMLQELGWSLAKDLADPLTDGAFEEFAYLLPELEELELNCGEPVYGLSEETVRSFRKHCKRLTKLQIGRDQRKPPILKYPEDLVDIDASGDNDTEAESEDETDSEHEEDVDSEADEDIEPEDDEDIESEDDDKTDMDDDDPMIYLSRLWV